MCPHRTKGCSFQGDEEEIADHVEYMVRIGDEDHMTEFRKTIDKIIRREPVSNHWIWSINLNDKRFEETEEDSNEVIAAKGMIRLYANIPDEATDRNIYFLDEFLPAVESAAEVLRARDLL